MRVRVIGAGVAGLTSAIRLAQAGFDTDLWAAARTPNTTSDRAGAWFTPPRHCASDAVLRWTVEGFRSLAAIAAEYSAESGVSMARVREFVAAPAPDQPGPHDAAPWWHGPTACALPDAAPAPPGYAAVSAARTPRMDITRYIPFLESRAIAAGVRITQRTITSLDEAFSGTDGARHPAHASNSAAAAPPRVVVNASGLGARSLAPDPAVRPMRGQVLHVANSWNWDEALIEEGRTREGAYIFPYRDHVVLGGTYEPDQHDAVTDEPALQGIIRRCAALALAAGFDPAEVRELGKARLRAVAGLRPARVLEGDAEAIRVEMQRLPGSDRIVIHNYGHGRCGISLSWGTAASVVELARRELS